MTPFRIFIPQLALLFSFISIQTSDLRAGESAFSEVNQLATPVSEALLQGYASPENPLPFVLSPLQADVLDLAGQAEGLAAHSGGGPCCPPCKTSDQTKVPARNSGLVVVRVSGNAFAPFAKNGVRYEGQTPDFYILDKVDGSGTILDLDFIGTYFRPDPTKTTAQIADAAYDYVQRTNFTGGGGMVGNSSPAPLTTESSAKLRQLLQFQALRYRMSQTASDADWNQILSADTAAWNVEQKKQFLSLMGQSFANHYDLSRLSIPVRHQQGKVTTLDILRAQSSPDRNAGVCSDIASAMGQLAQTMGFQDVYVVGYATHEVGHATLVARDPSDPTKILKYNYEEMSTAPAAKGANALIQKDDVGTGYKFYRPGGGQVASIPNEVGLLIDQALHGSTENSDRFARNLTPDVASLQIGGDRLHGTLFTGTTSAGRQIVGFAQTVATGPSDEVSDAGDESRVSGSLTGGVNHETSPFQKQSALRVYAELNLRLNSRWYKAAPELAFRAILKERSGIGRFYEHGSEATASEENSLITPALEMNYRNSSGGTHLRAEAAQQMGVGFSDVRDETTGLGLFRNLTYLSVKADQRLSSEYAALFDIAVGIRQFGSQVLTEGGVGRSDGTQKLVVGYEGRTNGEGPQFAPGMTRAAYLKMETALKGISLSGELWKSLEDTSAPQLRTRIRKDF